MKMGGGSPTAHAGLLLVRLGACVEREDAGQAVAAPLPVLGRCTKLGFAWMWTQDGQWGYWVLGRCSRDWGPCMDSEDAGQAVAAPPPVLGHCTKSGACDCGRKTGGGSPTAHAGSWVVACETGGLRGCGHKTGGGSPPPMLGHCSRNRGAHMDMAAPSPMLGRCS